MSLFKPLLQKLWNCLRPKVETVALCLWVLVCFVDSLSKTVARLIKNLIRWSKWKRKTPIHGMTVHKQPKKETLVESIERRTKQCLTIETALTEESLAKCNPQFESPLFQLPKELRDMIFEYASTQSDDLTCKHDKNAYYYRPGHVSRHKTYTSLLYTCRLAWLEANSLPMRQAEHTFWFLRGPYDSQVDCIWVENPRNELERYFCFLRSLTPSALSNVTYIHFFMQMFMAEEFSKTSRLDLYFNRYFLERRMVPKVFHITIRHSDWWYWEDGLPLRLDERWVQAILDAPHFGATEMFRLELETVASKKDEMDTIVQRLLKLEGLPTPVDPRNDDSFLASRFVPVDVPSSWQWSRSPRLDGKVWPVWKDVKELKLYVVTITWRKKHTSIRATESVTGLYRSLQSANQTLDSTLLSSTTRLLTPAMIMRRRARRVLDVVDSSERWHYSHHYKVVQSQCNDQAVNVEDIRRARFERLFADMEANQLAREWEVEGSLLHLKSLDDLDA